MYLFVALFALLTAAPCWGVGFLGPPPQTEQTDFPIVYKAKKFTLEERSLRIKAALSKDEIVVELRQVFFNVGKKPVDFCYYASLPQNSTIKSTSLPLKKLENDEGLEKASKLAITNKFPYVLGCLDGLVVHSGTINLPPHRPWVVRYTYSTPALAIGNERLFRIPLARRGPIGAPIRRVTISLRTIGGLSDRLECVTHQLNPPLPRKKWAYMSLRITDSIPEEDMVLVVPIKGHNRLSPLVYTDRDGTWVRSRIHLPKVSAKELKKTQALSSLFAIDVSGSLSGAPLETVKKALKDNISAMEKDDKFNIVPFALIPRSLHHEFLPLNKETIKEAHTYLDGLHGLGGTNLGETLQQAAELVAAAPAGTLRRLFLTIDGKADVGIIDPARLASLYHQSMPKDIRMETIAIGCNVDARLLATMVSQRSGRLRFAENAEEAKELLLSLFSTTRPRYKTMSISVQSGGLPISFRSNSEAATFTEIPLIIGTRLPHGRAPSVEMALTAHSATGSLAAASQTTYTASVATPSQAIGESVRSMFLVPAVAAVIEGLDRRDKLPPLSHWQEARVRRILRLPSGRVFKERLSDISRASGPEVRLRHRLLRQMKNSGTFLPRPYLPYVFRRVGPRIFFRARGGRWLEEPSNKKVDTSISYGSKAWLELVNKRPDLRPVLALGQHVRFVDGDRTYLVKPQS